MGKTSFGQHVYELRRLKGLSQFQLGKLVGVTDKAVSKWENGEAKPRFGHCIRLTEIFGVSLDELVSAQDGNNACVEKGRHHE